MFRRATLLLLDISIISMLLPRCLMSLRHFRLTPLRHHAILFDDFRLFARRHFHCHAAYVVY